MRKKEQTGINLSEEEILHGKEDAYGIYQIDWKGEGREYAFLSYDSIRAKGKLPQRKDYQLVYSGILEPDENMDSLYIKFNIAHPQDFTGHSLSVSDIIVLKKNGKINVSYVDMIGFVPLSDFYKEPALRVGGQIIEATQGFTAEGHFGTWHSIQMQEFHNEKFFQMRHDEFGEKVADIIVNEQGQVIAEDLWHGFSPEAMKLIGEYLLNRSLHEKKEAAYVISGDSGYFMIHETDGGYDYTFYNEDYRELDGGVYDNPDVSLAEAIEDILNDAGIAIATIEEIGYEQLEQNIEESEEKELLHYAVQESKRQLKGGDIRLTSEVYYKEKSLEGRSRADIEETVLSQAQIIVDELGLHNEVELIGARVYGSRSREGLYRPDSDVDVALSYQGAISEDSFFNYLKEDMLYVKEIPIDINPISKTKSGTLPEYLERAEYYLDEKEIEQFAEQIDTFGRLRGDWSLLILRLR